MEILLAHGSGGKLTRNLIKDFVSKVGNPILNKLTDSAIVEVDKLKLAFTTDSYVVKPIFFPGGDIGKLAVYGTINDLAVMGAEPLCISCSYIIEEGLDYQLLEKITESLSSAAQFSSVHVVTGDTKVVERGRGDGIFITTSGIGVCNYSLPQQIEVGDKILINGNIGEHELAILAARGELGLKSTIKSDCAPLWGLISQSINASYKIKFMRDPTRGGLATVLNEIIEDKEFGIIIDEEQLPVSEEVKGICSLLGFDPLWLANEGKVVIIVGKEDCERVIDIMHNHPMGNGARVIGEVVSSPKGMVCLKTKAGGTRIVDMPVGTQLPRIC